jgi:YVTN family beta-propeller protein
MTPIRRRPIVRLALAFAAAAMLLGAASSARTEAQKPPDRPAADRVSARVGRLPTGQIVTPAGRQIDLPELRPHVLALSPDGRLLVTSGRSHEIVSIDPVSGSILQRVPLPPEPPQAGKPEAASANILIPDEKGQASYTGLIFSPDGRRLFLSNVNGSIKVFDVAADGTISGRFAFLLPPANAPRRAEEIPSGIAVSPDGARLYIVLNLSGRLGEFDAADGRFLRAIDVGSAPYDVVLVRGLAFVSNWGGRRPQPGDATGPSGRGTFIKVDPKTFIADDGSVSVVDLKSWQVISEHPVQLHASALAVSPNERYVVCANAASDTLSVIDARRDAVVETICVKPSPADLFGASPAAVAFDPQGKTLYVANGTQNAVAVIDFQPKKRASRFLGLIPTGWWPGAILFDARRGQLVAANIKGLPEEKRLDKRVGAPGFNSHQYRGSISLIPVPAASELPVLTARVWTNYFRERIAEAFLPPRPGQPARPIPERIGEPSIFKHVVYVIKENRSYDQVLGDVAEGDGDPALTMFGETITPNQHKMVRDFVLLDNTYCNGILSADGHQWSTTAFSTDYMEKSFGGWPRSYPDGMGPDEADALAYAPTGFLWDNALRHGKTLRDYGEFTMADVRWADPKRKGDIDWAASWREYNHPTGEILFGSVPAIESLRRHIAAKTVGWSMEVPDQFRARTFIQELGEFEKSGKFPDLTIICLPNDHTTGTKEGTPKPTSHAADNDLAFGRIVEAISRSRFWKETVIVAIEDDPQDGWDHVSGYRTTAYVISPYTRRHRTISAFYNTVSLLRTIEQILGLPPMNQFDAAAVPMFEAFTDTPDFTPFTAVPNRVPLDDMNPPPDRIKDKLLRGQARISARLDFRRIDACPEDVLNRILWHAVKGSKVPYPEWAVRPRPDGEDNDD